jgi:hypothetical protein
VQQFQTDYKQYWLATIASRVGRRIREPHVTEANSSRNDDGPSQFPGYISHWEPDCLASKYSYGLHNLIRLQHQSLGRLNLITPSQLPQWVKFHRQQTRE